MKHALLLLLVALGGAPDAAPPDAAPAAAPAGTVATPPSPLALADGLLGRWAGEWKPAQGPARPISVTFAPGAPSAALAAEVTVGGVGRPRSVHRRAIVGGDAVRVGMPDGSQAVLRLVDGDLLVGEASRAPLRLLRQSQ